MSGSGKSEQPPGHRVWQCSHHRGWWLGAIGMLWVFGTLYVMGAALMPAVEINLANRLTILAIGVPFVAFVSWATLLRHGVEIDGEAGTVKVWWGIVVPMFSKQHPLSEFRQVTVKKKEVPTGRPGRTTTVYPVHLMGPKSTTHLDDYVDDFAARYSSEEVAKCCRFDIVDETGGRKIIRKLEQLDETIRQRMRRTGQEVPQVERPTELKSIVDEDAEGLVVELPMKPATRFSVVVMFLSIALLSAAFHGRMPQDNDAGKLMIWVGGVAVAASVAFVVRWIRRRLRLVGTMRVTATADMLTVETKGWLRGKMVEIPASDLEELELVEPQILSQLDEVPRFMAEFFHWLAESYSEIRARSDTREITIGGDIRNEEIRYIHAALLKVLASD